MPRSFRNGGWAWTSALLIVEAFVTTYCGYLLLDIRKKTNLTSYSEIGFLAYGKVGKIGVELALWLS